MRKLSDIVRSASIPGFSKHDAMVVVEYTIHAQGHNAIDVISSIYRAIEYPRSISPANVAHISGATDERIVFVSVWRSEQDAASAFAEAEQAIQHLTNKFGPDARVDRASHKAHRVTISDDIADYDARIAEINPDCVAFTIDFPAGGSSGYDKYCAEMDFPERAAGGLLLHVAYAAGEEFRTISVWRTIEDSQAFMRDRIIPAGPAVVRNDGIFPEVRPVEFKPTLLAFNLADGGRAS